MSRRMGDVRVYETSAVQRMTGASPRQLRYWDRTGLASPSIRGTAGKPGRTRLYSEADLAHVQDIVARLDAGETLQHIHKVHRHADGVCGRPSCWRCTRVRKAVW